MGLCMGFRRQIGRDKYSRAGTRGGSYLISLMKGKSRHPGGGFYEITLISDIVYYIIYEEARRGTKENLCVSSCPFVDNFVQYVVDRYARTYAPRGCVTLANAGHRPAMSGKCVTSNYNQVPPPSVSADL